MIATTKTVAGAVAVVFADPVFVDEEFVVVEVDETDGCWFMVIQYITYQQLENNDILGGVNKPWSSSSYEHHVPG